MLLLQQQIAGIVHRPLSRIVDRGLAVPTYLISAWRHHPCTRIPVCVGYELLMFEEARIQIVDGELQLRLHEVDATSPSTVTRCRV